MLGARQILIWLVLVIGPQLLYGQGHLVPIASADTLKPGENEHANKPKPIVETDQRFFFFKNSLNPFDSRAMVNVWGARAGVLLPNNIKIGGGYYFTSQQVGDAEQAWEGYHLNKRLVHYITGYIEPYFFRRRYWELSTPIEFGIGSAKYTLQPTDQQTPEIRRSLAFPMSIGVSVSTKFPPINWFRPLRWFGINLMTGYRLTLQQQIPNLPITYNGFYYSISPAVFLDRFYEDFNSWRLRHKKG